MRYFVVNDSMIPLYGQPENGYTKMQAISRAQREVEQCAKMFNISYFECASWFHILDSKMHYCVELDTAI